MKQIKYWLPLLCCVLLLLCFTIHREPVSAECTTDDFEMKLFTTKTTWRTDEAIKIWATLKYVGDSKDITIFYAPPYMNFCISGEDEFYGGGLAITILDHTTLKRGKLYSFDYNKAGAYDGNAPDADFWKEFYEDPELHLPAGTYTISVSGAFDLAEDINEGSGLYCEMAAYTGMNPPHARRISARLPEKIRHPVGRTCQ